MKKGFLKGIIIVIIGVLILCLTFVWMYSKNISPVDENDNTPITVTISQGSGAYSIIDILKEKGLIKNVGFAKLYIRLNSYDKLQANTYILNKAMSLEEIFNIINTGDFNYISKRNLTVIEGSTIPQVAEAVAKVLKTTKDKVLDTWSDGVFLKKMSDKYWFLDKNLILKDGIMFPLEGYLYPETYFLTDETKDIESVTQLLLDKTGKELEPLKSQIADMDFNVHEFLTLTSVVQGESLFDKDRSIIAGVFMNRLRKANMPLQSDITVLYALQEKRVNVTNSDLSVDSPYNTYKYSGLPIGPVCAVNSKVMSDVINYDKNDYLFFFATKEGKVIYSKTYEEHERIVKENLWY